MCEDCGCSDPHGFRIHPGKDGETHTHADGTNHSHAHDHPHGHDHSQAHDHGREPDHHHLHDHVHREDLPLHPGSRRIEVQRSLLEKNDRLAERNRGYFLAKGVTAINLVSAPGSGKTRLIERLLEEHGARARMAVIVGDLETERDAERLRRFGIQAIQITTGTACHLDAGMIAAAFGHLDWTGLRLLFLENVGNLVCPALFDLGEQMRIGLLSVTEGEDKPLKYPGLFQSCQAVLITKIDLAEAVGFDRGAALANLQAVAPGVRVFECSGRTGEGMAAVAADLFGLGT